jgi:hypothetical protein
MNLQNFKDEIFRSGIVDNLVVGSDAHVKLFLKEYVRIFALKKLILSKVKDAWYEGKKSFVGR